jgi:hypothetical protein
VVKVPSRQGRPDQGWVEKPGPVAREARGQILALVYSGNPDLKRLHFSTVFVAVLWGAGFPESEASFPRPQ